MTAFVSLTLYFKARVRYARLDCIAVKSMQRIGWCLISRILAARIILQIVLFCILQDLSQQGDTCIRVLELIILSFVFFLLYIYPSSQR
jgi:hypothetical protein